MGANTYATDDIVRRGQERYEREIRAAVEAAHHGEMLALDVETGDYETAPDSLTALNRLTARRPNAVVYILRVGYPTAVRLGNLSVSRS